MPNCFAAHGMRCAALCPRTAGCPPCMHRWLPSLQLTRAGIKVGRLVSGIVAFAFFVDLIVPPGDGDDGAGGDGRDRPGTPPRGLRAFLPRKRLTGATGTPDDAWADALKPGDTITAVVYRVDERGGGRVTLSTMELETTPGEHVHSRRMCTSPAGRSMLAKQQAGRLEPAWC